MKVNKIKATLLITIFMILMFAVEVQAMHFLGMNGGSLSVISLDLSALPPEEAFNAEPETLMLGDMAFDAQSDTVTITGTLSELNLGAGWPVSWPDTAYVEIGVRPSATKLLKNSGVYMIFFASGNSYVVHLQDYTGHGNSLSFTAGPELAPFTYEITLNPNTGTGIGGTANLVLYDKEMNQVDTNIEVEYGYASTWQENVAGELDEDFSEAYLFYSIIADRRGVPDVTYSATVGDIMTNILLPHLEVWVDDDYYDGGDNDGHVWGIDAFDTIQEGVDVVDEGGTVLVHSGAYYEYILIDKALTVKSIGGAEETIIDGNGYRYIVTIQHSDVTFEGFTVTDPTYAAGSDATGILVGAHLGESVNNVNILDNIVTQVRSEAGIPSMYGATGINIGKGPLSDIVISGNTITDIKNPDGASVDHTCGINVWDGAENVLISNNDISDIKFNGIILEYAINVRIEGNSISECEVGIRVDPFDGVTVSGLTINYNNLFGNTDFGVFSTMEEEVDAEMNWWGEPSGPSGEGGGTGDAVSTNVDYYPWLTGLGD